MENWTYKTNLPQCPVISSSRPVQVGEVVCSYHDDGRLESAVYGLVTSKINGRLALTPVKFVTCKIEGDDAVDADKTQQGRDNPS